MTYPLPPSGAARPGASYALVAVRGPSPLPVLRELRFSGWLAAAGPWHVVVASAVDRPVASGRRGVVGVGAALAATAATVLAIRVVDERQLLLVLWSDGTEAGRYDSMPDYDGSADAYGDPAGVDLAPALAAACDRPFAAPDLTDLLAEELDPDSRNESERLVDVLRLLDLPLWLVAVPSLPRDVPTGPAATAFTRLRAPVRRRRWSSWPPPP